MHSARLRVGAEVGPGLLALHWGWRRECGPLDLKQGWEDCSQERDSRHHGRTLERRLTEQWALQCLSPQAGLLRARHLQGLVQVPAGLMEGLPGGMRGEAHNFQSVYVLQAAAFLLLFLFPYLGQLL